MKTSKITLYFILISFVATLSLGSALYIFIKEKNNTLNEVTKSYRDNSSKLIIDKIHEDLILDNLLEARRKLLILQENKIIKEFQIIKLNQSSNKNLEYCEIIFFDRILKTTQWGKVCLTYESTSKEKNAINLERISLIFFSLALFIFLLIVLLFKKIKLLNKELYSGVSQILNNHEMYNIKNSFWEPVLYELKKLVISKKNIEKKIFDQKLENEKIELATQVAHDIRAPLATLKNINLDHFKNDDEKKLVIKVIERLNGIANTLLNNGNVEITEELSITDLLNLTKNIIQAKSIEFPQIKIETQLAKIQVFSQINEIKLESILSNLLTNSIEASEKSASIMLQSEIDNMKYIIKIIDQGKGIPPEILLKLGKEKITFNKLNGNGLGIFYAAKTIQSWGGSFDIQSQVNHGTTVKISLPIVNLVKPPSLNILIDNDELVCLTWEMKARKAKIDLKIFKTSNDLFDQISQLDIDSTFYIDSELDNEKGEDIAVKLFDMGYLNLIICSGHPKEKFLHLNFIKNVISKAPPF